MLDTTPLGWSRLQAICVFEHQRFVFNYQFARSSRATREAYQEGVGVCRDFAHLAVTLCGCMNIPARYCTGYLGNIAVPSSCSDSNDAISVRSFSRRTSALNVASLAREIKSPTRLQKFSEIHRFVGYNTQVLAIRRELSEQSIVLGRVLKSARAIGFDLPTDHKLTKAFATFDRLSASSTLPVGEENPFGRSWQKLIDQLDRASALKKLHGGDGDATEASLE